MIDGFTVIDFHAHQGRWDQFGMRDDPARQIEAMDLAGIDHACLFNIFHPDMRTGHEQLRAYVQAAAGRFIGFAYATPLCPDMVEETARAIDQLGFRAIKIYPPTGNIIVTDARWRPLFEFADRRGLTIISHTGTEPSCEPRLFAEVAPRYPNARFVLGHSGNVLPQRQQAIAAAQQCPNVYLETCSTYRQPGVIEGLVEGAGADRVLFGSDMPLMDPRCQIGKILTACIPDLAKRLVLGENAARLLRM